MLLLALIRARPFEAVVGRVYGRWERACSLVLLVVLFGLVPLAEASPPDPMWIAGIYDGGDFDEVVVAILSATGLVGTPVVPAMPVDIPAGEVQPRDTVPGVAAPSFTFTIRAPPSVTSIAAP